ncbi:MAG: DNA mismatch repair endonuclease MutL [Lachnospiraceae bacterium]
MSRIQVLDQITIDKIAAGEVIERPASVIKELTENAIDAGATAVTVEIKEGGISLMRIADNGCGIEREDVRCAFLRHSTSKIRSAEDLFHIASLGFRGEALSSIAAVSQVELLTKTREDEFGTRYRICGGKEEELEEAAAPDGTTFLVRQLFYNTPARKKFLKTAMTEAGHVGDLMTRLALSHPEISFRFINNGQVKLHTSGNGNVKDVIYHVYGREAAANLLKADYERNGIRITGFLGKPVISRGNRNFENYFVSGRYIKSNMISKGIEDAYKDFSMQHKYPFVVLHMELDGEHVDVNVHPAKLEVRFNNQQEVYNAVYEAVSQGLHEEELIPHITLEDTPRASEEETRQKAAYTGKSGNTGKSLPVSEAEGIVKETAEAKKEKRKLPPPSERDLDYFMEEMKKRVRSYHEQNSAAEVKDISAIYKPEVQSMRIREAVSYDVHEKSLAKGQMNLFEDKLLAPQARPEHKIIGQVFDTYWLVEYHDNLYIIDQHAAHERVLYEKTLKGMKTREFTSQMVSPPIVLNLTMQEKELLETYMERFIRIGFEFEEFGQDSYAVRAVPDNLFGIAKKELLLEMLDSLSDEISRNAASELIDEKVASMSCKAAVKGNMRLSAAEMDTLIGELLTLENPYHCPHGRPTIIAMSKRELEKKFKRIV